MAEAEGIPPTASVVVPGLSLNYIGEHCYAFSGGKSASIDAADHLSFLSGEGYIVGRLYLNGTNESGSGSGETTTADVKFNGVTVARLRTETSAADMAATVFNDLTIPPFTKVQVTVHSAGASANRKTTLVFNGRVYGVG